MSMRKISLKTPLKFWLCSDQTPIIELLKNDFLNSIKMK
ncbi:hypothetical protein HPHPP11B_1098 [Helicobacter pylori Hp P-11b]|uniref:Uncharacterized protein n=1 Tax=Helicobacter pylori Hp P-11b TaxID=992106 RepID=J0S261_HELPX|nr:hypothetical protein HPHPP11_1226 [Helicobacter pylori Hp P-11]EJC29561.1 hypothetical protein HPHPP11B_1098 [Helicobacter pylori Hp P-11b]